jgi:Tol biopolymer transport system component
MTATPPHTMRFEMQPPADTTWAPAPVSSTAQLALAPNGEQIAFIAAAKGSASQIWVRAFRTIEARALPETNGASFPFWSPDSRFIGFFADGKLKKVDASGGRPQTLADAPTGRGGAWGPRGVIVFTPSPSQGLFRVHAEGGAVTPLTNPDETGGITHYWPQFLSDGERVLFYQRAAQAELQGIYVSDLRTGTTRAVMPHDARAVYAAGYLLLVREGMLFAHPFDERRLQLTGEAMRVADSVGYFGGTFGDTSVTASDRHALAHGPRVVLLTSLQWHDRNGAVISRVTTPGAAYRSPMLTPDEKTVAFSLLDPRRAEGPDIWTVELTRGILTRLTMDPRNDWFPVWSEDGQQVYFGSTRAGSTGLFRKVPGGSAQEEALTEPSQFGRYPTDIANGGAAVVYHEVARDGYDLGLMETTGAQKPRKFLATRFNEVQGRLSPNQRWMAYASDESGRFEVYVRPFPDGTGQWTISVAGGMQPRWRRDGKELFYLAQDGRDGRRGDDRWPAFSPSTPHALFSVEDPGRRAITDYAERRWTEFHHQQRRGAGDAPLRHRHPELDRGAGTLRAESPRTRPTTRR